MAKRDRKLQVFVSSTYKDLITERQAAVGAILKAGHIPAGMELFTAGDLSQMDTIKNWIDESDVYVLLLGGRYGSVETTTLLSYTELEYDYATSRNKPVFSIVQTEHSLEAKVKTSGTEVIEKDHQKELKLFREKVLSKMSSFFSDEKDIRLAILESLPDFENDERVVGWVRASTIPDQTAINTELALLREENRAVREELDAARAAKEAATKRKTEDWRELVDILKAIKLTVPAALAGDGAESDVETNLFDLAEFNKDTLINGVSNRVNMNARLSFLYFNVLPKLQMHGLADNERVPGQSYRRGYLNKAGQTMLAAYEREKLTKNTVSTKSPENTANTENSDKEPVASKKKRPPSR